MIVNALRSSRTATAAQRKKQAAKKVTRAPAAADDGRALDHCLYETLGFGLEKYIDDLTNHVGMGMSSHMGKPRPFLKLCMDEESAGFKFSNFFFYGPPKGRGWACRDFCHKYHRDSINSMSAAGLLGDVAKLLIMFDVTQGPWLSGDALGQLNEALELFLQCSDDTRSFA